MRSYLLAFFLLPVNAIAICLNLLGCEPKTQGECIRLATEARTDSAAKTMIAECRKLPQNTEGECRTAEKEWAAYLTKSGGVEWYWPNRLIKIDCKKHYPKTFAVSLWVTKSYCDQNVSRISEIPMNINKMSRRPQKLENAIRKNGYGGIDDWVVFEHIQQKYYPDRPPADLAKEIYLDAPPDPLDVAEECQKINGLAP